MLIEEVSLFNQYYCLKNNISVPTKIVKVVNEILKIKCPEIDSKKKKDRSKATNLVDEILYIEEDDLNFMFTASMLFVGYDIDKIAEYVGVSVKAVELFKQIYFDVSKFRGVLGKVSFFKKMLFSEERSMQELGVILKAAHIFGSDYIEWKFALNTTYTTPEHAVKNTFKDMYFKHMEKSFNTDAKDIENHIRNGKQLISAASDMQKTMQTNNGSGVDDIKKYLVELNDEVMNNSTWSSSFEVIDLNMENSKK